MATVPRPQHRTADLPAEPNHDLATRDRLKVIVLAVATAIVVYLCYLLMAAFLPALVWAGALAVMGRPIHKWVTNRVKLDGAAAGLTVALVVVLIVVPVVFVVHQVGQQAAVVLAYLQDEEQLAEWQAALEQHPTLAPAVEWVQQNINLAGEAQRILGFVTENITSWLTATVWLLMQLLIMLLALFYLFRDRSYVLDWLRSLVPLSTRETYKVFRAVDDTIHATVFGTITVSAVQGLMGSIIFWLLGIPSALLWGVIMGLLAIVPYLGAFVIWGPVAVYLGLQGDWTRAVILTAYGMLAIGLIDNLLYPMLVGSRMRLHTLVAFFGILGGVAAFGATGIVIGPVVVALAFALLDIWRTRTAEGQGAENPS